MAGDLILGNKFSTITILKTSDPKYQEKLQSSLTGEFNRVQAEMGKQTISDFLARYPG